MNKKPNISDDPADLRRRAEAQLSNQRKSRRAKAGGRKSEADIVRVLHELEVHQIELEMQNLELRNARNELEVTLEKYTDLYDFAPVGYFTLAADGTIQLVNLTGASLVGIERSRLVGQSFERLVTKEQRPVFNSFLKQIFASQTRQSSDFEILIQGKPPRAVNLEAQRLLNGQECRIAVMDITARKRVEVALHASEERLRLSQDVAHVGTFDWDIESGVNIWTPKLEAMYGLPPGGFAKTQATWERLVHPDDRAAAVAGVDQTLRTGQTVEGEWRVIWPDGSVHWLAGRFRAFKDKSGKAVRLAGVNIDITTRKQAEAKVRVSEVRFRRLFETARDGILLLDPVTRKITDANPFMTKLLGYPRNQLVGKELFEIGLLKDKAASQEMFQKLKRKHEVRYEDLPLETRAGRHQEVEVVANLYQEDGHAVIQCNIRDITERKQTEIALSRLAAIIEYSDDAIIGKDPNGIITSWNRGAEKIFGYTARQMVGSSIMRLIPSDRRDEEKHIQEKIRCGESVRHFETLRQTKDGRLIHVSVTTSPIKDVTGKVIGVSKVARDISARKQVEERLRQNEAMFSALIAQAPIGVYVVDDKMCLQQVNPKALPVFRQVHPLIGRDFSEVMRVLWPRSVADQVVQRFRHTLKTGEPYQTSNFTERRRDTGAKEIYEWQIQRVTLPAGAHGVVCFFSNITGRKRAEAAQRRNEVLAASNRKLEQEIVRRQAVEKVLKKSQQHQIRLLEQSQTMQEQLRNFSHQILMAQEEERRRISRELHDVIAQTLTGINVHLANLKISVSRDTPGLEQDITRAQQLARTGVRRGRRESGLEQNITRTQRLVEHSVKIIHQFARELRPAVLDDLGLIPALNTFMKHFRAETGLRVSLSADVAVEQVIGDKRTVLYRVAQEALTNIARHAHASRADVKIQKLDGAVCMTITDDGKGFLQKRQLQNKKKQRLGLLGMSERVEMVRGSFTVQSKPGKGTTVRVQIPLAGAGGGAKGLS